MCYEGVTQNEYHAIFCDSRYNWTAPAAFTWTGTTGIMHLGDWPGTKMTPITYNGKPAWEIRFKHDTEPSHIIFNDGKTSGAVQTGDLPFKNNYVYTFDGYDEPISSVEDILQDAPAIEAWAEGGDLLISTEYATKVTISSIDGRSRVMSLRPGDNRIALSAPGIYIISAPGVPSRKIAVIP